MEHQNQRAVFNQPPESQAMKRPSLTKTALWLSLYLIALCLLMEVLGV